MAARRPKKLPTIPKAPAELADLWHVLAEGQLASYRRLHQICDDMLTSYAADVADAGGDRPVLTTSSDLRNLAAVLDIAVAGEIKAVQQQYRDQNVAIAAVQQLGFIVQDPRSGAVAIDPDVVPKYKQGELL